MRPDRDVWPRPKAGALIDTRATFLGISRYVVEVKVASRKPKVEGALATKSPRTETRRLSNL
jgi:hypothetical protein